MPLPHAALARAEGGGGACLYHIQLYSYRVAVCVKSACPSSPISPHSGSVAAPACRDRWVSGYFSLRGHSQALHVRTWPPEERLQGLRGFTQHATTLALVCALLSPEHSHGPRRYLATPAIATGAATTIVSIVPWNANTPGH